jgi:hypothetical protein
MFGYAGPGHQFRGLIIHFAAGDPRAFMEGNRTMRLITRVAVLTGTVAASLAPAAAQAAPARAVTADLGTYDFGRAAVIGQAGMQSGLWDAYAVRSGFIGDALIVSHPRRTAPSRTEIAVYTAAFNEVADPQAECNRVGAAGAAQKTWFSFRCRTGFVPSYTLLVR